MDPAQAAPFAIQFQPPPVPTSDVNTIPAANPPPTFPPSAPSHPSYAEMITAAILWENSQGKEGGSSKRAIEKYIDRVYANLPPTHSALLSHHLKRLKNSGQLVMIKNSYQLPSFVPPPPQHLAPPPHPAVPVRSMPAQPQPQSFPVPDNFPTPKRKPGRPPKPKDSPSPAQTQPQAQAYTLAQQQAQIQAQFEQQAQSVAVSGSNGVKRRGRPRKNPLQNQQLMTAEVPFVQPVTQAQPISQVQPVYVADPGLNNGVSGVKQRGRPRKKQLVPQQAPPLQQQPAQQQQTQHYAQQEVPVAENGGVVGVKKRMGRPPKAKAIVGAVVKSVAVAPARGVGRGRGRPRREEVLAPVSTGVVGKKRGWPRGKPRGTKKLMNGGEVVGVGVNAGGVKRRGRPPRGTTMVGVAKEVRPYYGKPRGRPKRNASLSSNQASDQGQANEELLKKLENMQLKIRDAVGVLRPHVANQDASDALTALQHLEDLSAMDLNATPALTVSAPEVTMPMDVSALPPSTSAPESIAPQDLTAPPMMMGTAPSSMSAPFPYGVSLPTMTAPGPLNVPVSIENQQQPMSWIPSSEAQS